MKYLLAEELFNQRIVVSITNNKGKIWKVTNFKRNDLKLCNIEVELQPINVCNNRYITFSWSLQKVVYINGFETKFVNIFEYIKNILKDMEIYVKI